MAGEWREQLPADLKTNEAFTSFDSLGDFGKGYLDVSGKLKESEGKVKSHEGEITTLKGKLENSIAKLPDDASEEERKVYYEELGVPQDASEYEFPEGDGIKHDEKTVKWARDTFHAAHLTKDQAKVIGQQWDQFIGGLVKADVEAIQKANEKADTQMKAELGTAYEGRVELAKRFLRKHLKDDAELNSILMDVPKQPLATDARFIRMILKFAAATGEDFTPPGTPRKEGKASDWYPKTDFSRP